MATKINPRYRHHCESCDCLGEVVINNVRADVFVCDDIVLARFSASPDDYEAAHLHTLTMSSNIFLLTAFRLYLDKEGSNLQPQGLMSTVQALQS